ncbi:MAG TPA: CopG family antitoxin [Victivallales bacterium]|jgi:hypothetical protein|nr:CopG family antitoxin [Victivallales bacterium]|tara:strand:- start:1645 stop:1890 length:246 start_codon:yes stop_codon:yes gene_type:complete
MKTIKAKDFEKKFDNGEDVSEYIDFSKGKRLNREIQKVNVDMPKWMVRALDKKASRLNISRQAVIKTMLAHDLDEGKMRVH